MARLPRDRRGYLVPWFVGYVNGEPDFRVMDGAKATQAVREKLCWLCGQTLGRHLAFNIGPMCAINRVSSEPPSHRDCAVYAAQACPFLTQPSRPRRPQGMPADGQQPAGMGLDRNPGVALVWITTSYRVDHIHPRDFKAGAPIRSGVLFQVGDPEECLWFCQGRPATRWEVLDSILTGLPALQEAARADGDDAVAALDLAVARALVLVPARRETDGVNAETKGGRDETTRRPGAAPHRDRETAGRAE